MSTYELRSAIQALGYQLSDKVTTFLVLFCPLFVEFSLLLKFEVTKDQRKTIQRTDKPATWRERRTMSLPHQATYGRIHIDTNWRPKAVSLQTRDARLSKVSLRT